MGVWVSVCRTLERWACVVLCTRDDELVGRKHEDADVFMMRWREVDDDVYAYFIESITTG